MRSHIQRARPSQLGFSFLEVILTVVIIGTILGAILSQVSLVQQRARAEAIKLDSFQESREFVDGFVRDLHLAGYPNIRMFDTSSWSPALNSPPWNDSRLAAGVIYLSPSQITFEGDVDGDGQVDVVEYKLITAGNNCPCIQRSQVLKPGGAVFSVQVQNIQNAGTNADPVFVGYKSDGTLVNSADTTTTAGLQTLASLRTIKITLKVKAVNVDPQTGLAPEVSLNASVTLVNCSMLATGQTMSCQ